MTVVNYINASLKIWGSVMSGVVALCMVLSKRPFQRSDRVYLVCLTCNAGVLSLIQPHFLYNTLTAICGLCDEDPKEAKRVTAKFSDYLRHSHHFHKGTRGLL